MNSKSALIILDGFGITAEKRGNAVLMAKTPFIDELLNSYPKTLLSASAIEVGLPWGEAGNSEVGHTNLGLGRVVLQDLPQIDSCFEKKEFLTKKSIVDLVDLIGKTNRNLHLIGVLSDGAVHGHIRHLELLIQAFKTIGGLGKIYLHLIADGRDVPEKSIERYAEIIKNDLDDKVAVASLSGRYFAMDRDKNWERIEGAYNAILGEAKIKAQDLDEAIKLAYGRGETDEFISPTVINKPEIDLENDVFVFSNYRADRAIQLTRAFVDENFTDFQRSNPAKNFYTMTTYDDNLAVKVFFSNLDLNNPESNPLLNPLPKLICESGLSQCHIAETEKFAHVTYFFAGGVKEPYEKQENKLIETKKVKSHDLYPQMRAFEISATVKEAAEKNVDFIVCNFANGDMVGHTGLLDPTIKAVEYLDQALKECIPALLEKDYSVFLTADHGNCDEMIELKSGKPNKEHSHNPVMLVNISNQSKGQYMSKEEFFAMQPVGVLADVSPTILGLMGINTTAEMTGMDLRESMV